MASSPITSWQIDGETMETVTDFILGGSKITADGECSQEIKRGLLLGRKAMTNLESILKSRDITWPTKEIRPEYSLERLMLKLKLQFFGYRIRRADSFEKTLMLRKIEGGRRRGQQRMMVGWHHRLSGHEFEQTLELVMDVLQSMGQKESARSQRPNYNN